MVRLCLSQEIPSRYSFPEQREPGYTVMPLECQTLFVTKYAYFQKDIRIRVFDVGFRFGYGSLMAVIRHLQDIDSLREVRDKKAAIRVFFFGICEKHGVESKQLI